MSNQDVDGSVADEAFKQRPRHEWPKPEPLVQSLLPVPPFEPRFLPGPLQQMAAEHALSVPTALDFVGASLHAATGSLIADKCCVSLKRECEWFEVPNSWGLCIGGVSSKKTPAMAPMQEALRAIDGKHYSEYKSDFQRYESAKREYEAQSKESRGSAQTGKPEPIPPQVEPELPKERRVYTSDSTPEAMAVLSQAGSVLLFDEEISGLLSRLSDPRNQSHRAYLLQAWNGNAAHRQDRIGRGSIYVRRLCNSVFGNAQPSTLHRFLLKSARDGSHADGLLQRFGLTAYPNPVSHTELVEIKVDLIAKQSAVEAIVALTEYSPLVHGAVTRLGGSYSPFFELGDDAYEEFRAWYRWHSEESQDDGYLEAYRQHVLKLPKVVATVALSIHVIEGFHGPISGTVMKRATDAARYYAAHAKRVYYTTARDVYLEPARVIARRISRGEIEGEISTRKAQNGGWAGCDTSGDTQQIFGILEGADWLKSIPQLSSASGGRPTTRWLVNPCARGAKYT